MSVTGPVGNQTPAQEGAKVHQKDANLMGPVSQVVKQEHTPAEETRRLVPFETPVDEQSAIKRDPTQAQTHPPPPAVEIGGEQPQWEARPITAKRSRSPLRDFSRQDRGWGAPNADGKSRGWDGCKKMKRDESPELIVTILYSDDAPQQLTHGVCGSSDLQRRVRVDYGAERDVPTGDPPDEAGAVVLDCAVSSGDVVPGILTSTPIGSEPTPRHSDVAEGWLLDSAVCSRSGMLVTVRGSRAFRPGAAWHGGDYEGAWGIVLSVHNTGADNETFPSTARVKLLKPLHPSGDTLIVPAALLWPVQPDAEQQEALIIDGQYRGYTAKLLYEVSEGRWYVSGAYDYFEIASGCLVRLLPTGE
ncbi:hypothetical protein C8Q78DRAFT_1078935 [Trametes maxima]|nr:hypothetical protein C8Q78DRAFT_1078935 [Trametes maxima]